MLADLAVHVGMHADDAVIAVAPFVAVSYTSIFKHAHKYMAKVKGWPGSPETLGNISSSPVKSF